MKILAIDISLNSTGACVWAQGVQTPEHIRTITNDVGGDIGPKLIKMYEEVLGLLEASKADVVVLEDIFVGPNPKTTITLAKVHGVILLAAETKGIPVVYLTSTKIKKAFSVKKKADVFKKVCEMFPETTNNFTFNKHNDVVDAIAIAYAYQRNHEPQDRSSIY